MIAFIRGIVDEVGTDYVVLDVDGVGYLVYSNTAALSQLDNGKTAKLLTALVVREDAMTLYGFLTQREKHLFERLQTVSGVGPKLAMAILSHLSAQQLSLALAQGDTAMLRRVPGVGNKTAQRLILELKEQMSKEQLSPSAAGASVSAAPSTFNAATEAVQALITLGYTSGEATTAIESVMGAGDRVEDLVMAALKKVDAKS